MIINNRKKIVFKLIYINFIAKELSSDKDDGRITFIIYNLFIVRKVEL